MKIQIDTAQKTITVQNDVNLKDFISILDKFFPNKEWQDYQLKTETVINNWTSPIIIQKTYPTPYWQNPNVVWYAQNSTNEYALKAGTYNLEVE